MEKINFGNIEEYVKNRFEFRPNQTLFDPQFDALKLRRCPLCFRKLRFVWKNRTIMMCRGVKHPKPFVIKIETLKKHDKHSV